MSELKPNVLLIDADADFSSTIVARLISDGYGLRWLKLLSLGGMRAEEGYRIILLDLTTPGASPQEFISELKRRWPGALIVSTTSGHVTTNGINFYLPKPFTANELSEVLANLSAV